MNLRKQVIPLVLLLTFLLWASLRVWVLKKYPCLTYHVGQNIAVFCGGGCSWCLCDVGLWPCLVRLWISKSSCEKSAMEKQLWKIWCDKDVGHLANQMIQLFQILARSGIRFWKARPGLLPLLVQILAADFWNRILLGSPFGSDSTVRQRNPSIKDEPNRAYNCCCCAAGAVHVGSATCVWFSRCGALALRMLVMSVSLTGLRRF